MQKWIKKHGFTTVHGLNSIGNVDKKPDKYLSVIFTNLIFIKVLKNE